MSDFNEQRIVTARKVHNCEFCKKQIQPGERYSYGSGAFEGDFYTRKLCPECFDMLDTFCKENGYGEFSWDWVTDWLHDLYCHDCPSKEDCDSFPQQCGIIRGNFAGTFARVN